MATATKCYKVLQGVHYHNDVKGVPVQSPSWDGNKFSPKNLFKQGDIIKSEVDMASEFPNKFAPVDESKTITVSDARRQAVSELISGGYWNAEDKTFLEELTDMNFERILRQTQKSPASSSAVEDNGGDRKRRSSRLGEDITDEFGRAYDEGLKVWRNPAGKCQVTKQGVSLKPLNPEPLEASEVEKFVEEYLAAAKG